MRVISNPGANIATDLGSKHTEIAINVIGALLHTVSNVYIYLYNQTLFIIKALWLSFSQTDKSKTFGVVLLKVNGDFKS